MLRNTLLGIAVMVACALPAIAASPPHDVSIQLQAHSLDIGPAPTSVAIDHSAPQLALDGKHAVDLALTSERKRSKRSAGKGGENSAMNLGHQRPSYHLLL